MTAWTVNEVQNAREIKRDPHVVTPFLTAERLRRFRQMIKDFCSDLERDGANWLATTIYDLQDAAGLLRERLSLLAFRRPDQRASG